MLTDTHCHLASYKFSPEEVPSLVANAQNRGVSRVVCVGTEVADSEQSIKLAQQHPSLAAAVGIHPTDVTENLEEDLKKIEQLIQENTEDIAAIGETGLDYYHPAPEGVDEEVYRQRQLRSLEQHFEFASKYKRNIILHTRDQSGTQSFDDALAIYRKYADHVRAVFHCFIFDESQAQKIFELGGLISFTGIVTYKKPPISIDLAKSLPTSHFMLETDAPYLTPTPHRGKRNEPGYTRDILEFLASQRNESSEQLAEEIEKTVESFFHFS